MLGLSLYLQIGNNIKKVQYTGEISLSALRMLFIEKFNYSSGLNDFPSIYIRDPAINVSYELENLQEVTNKSVLSLNVDGMFLVIYESHVMLTYLNRECGTETVAATSD